MAEVLQSGLSLLGPRSSRAGSCGFQAGLLKPHHPYPNPSLWCRARLSCGWPGCRES